MFGGFLKSVVKSADEVLFSGVKVRWLVYLLLTLILIASCFLLQGILLQAGHVKLSC